MTPRLLFWNQASSESLTLDKKHLQPKSIYNFISAESVGGWACRPSFVRPCIWRTSPLKPLCQFSSNFMWNLLLKGGCKIIQTVAVHYLVRRPPCQNMVKTIPKTFLQNQVSFGTESLYKAFRAQRQLMTIGWPLRYNLCAHVFVRGKCWKIIFFKINWKLKAEVYNVSQELLLQSKFCPLGGYRPLPPGCLHV